MTIFNTIFKLPLGRKSILIGVHQFIWHPITVYIAWIECYKRFPTFKESVCILIHDWGYWNAPNMDGAEGETHPEAGAKIAGFLFGKKYYDLVLYHSRHYARRDNVEPSALCWPDKLSIKFDPKLFYLLRATITGEIKEYRQSCRENFSVDRSNGEWFDRLRQDFIKLAAAKKSNAIPYQEKEDIRGNCR
ncbi:MAG: hypothetical protein JWM44_2069 [Bacilli bacterium]|nr:hypothetical protein [Bacilli bacterium]